MLHAVDVLNICFPQAAVDMMRKVLNTVNMDGTIVIGEGEKDEVVVWLGFCFSSCN